MIAPKLASPVYSLRAAAGYLGISPRTLATLAARSAITYVRLSERRVGFLQEHLDAYLARRTVAARKPGAA